ncbi:MAG: DUF4397 domain-containing protein [Anaerolineales bacterium]|nr:MAG: DUF4397 domain-containing protein [Anaerolineales bacterium]
MSKISKLSLIGALFALVLGLAFSAAPAFASGHTFDIYVKHNINGQSLGLDKALPVDVYINDDYVFTFEFGDSVSTSLEAGSYKIDVKLAGTDTTVMSVGPVDIPAGADVNIKAKLSANKTPTLKVKIK